VVLPFVVTLCKVWAVADKPDIQARDNKIILIVINFLNRTFHDNIGLRELGLNNPIEVLKN
jgi:hypothetical protein